MLRFQWDEEKNRTNLTKHGVTFSDAVLVFDDLGRIEWIDDRIDYGEERIIVLGMARQQLLHMVFVERSPFIRIVSARKATREEANDYFSR